MPEVLAFARGKSLPITLLGGGSNVIVADEGFRGLTLQLKTTGYRSSECADRVRLSVDAGCDWDELVDTSVEHGWAGIECLTGIPGHVGAAPIQNIGAYGQEVAEVIDSVDVFDLESGSSVTHSREECAFGYRTSHFKRVGGHRLLVTAVHLVLRPDAPTIRYAELQKRLTADASLTAVRDQVRALRASKSMLARGGPNRHSAGSFFLNPVVCPQQFQRVKTLSAEKGIPPDTVPHWTTPGGIKLAAAWLIEQTGFGKGYGAGRVGLSTHHTLALVNRAMHRLKSWSSSLCIFGQA